MAAYASLVSLMNTIDHIQNHPPFSTSIFDNKQVESLGEKLDFLLDFIESRNHSHGELLLESQIAYAAYAAEDVIESHVVDQIHSGSVSSLDLRTVLRDMDSVQEMVVNVKVERRLFKDLVQHTYPSDATSSTRPVITSPSTMMVGFDDELIQLWDALTGQQSSLQIIPIVGMGGIGKTTLVKNVYEKSLSSHHFDFHGWATISQEYSMGEIFSKLFYGQSTFTGGLDGETEHQLAQKLYQSLIGRRYLIILDDVWSTEVWDKIMFFFPDNNNKSRIIVTTRLSNTATYFVSSYLLRMKCLDEDKSWKLFCEKVFPQEGCCPPELEKIGKKIAEKCKGLLGKSFMTREYWKDISRDLNSILNSREDEEISCLDILSLSYRELPAHLKPCFLYMGIFPEDNLIRASNVIRLWLVEGFVKTNKTRSLEEVAEGYLKDLVDRNLVLAGELRWNGKIRRCSVHDLVRDLCLKEAQKERFLYVMRVGEIPRDLHKERRIVFHERFSDEYDPRVFDAMELAPLTRSLISNVSTIRSSKFRLLRVWNVVDGDYSLDDIFNHVNLRYMYNHCFWRSEVITSSMLSLLWNLQTLIIKGRERVLAPSEIWEMRQLRYLDFLEISLTDPPQSDHQGLQNLQTLKTAVNLRFSAEVCKRIPNVKKLKIKYDDDSLGQSSSWDYYCLYNLGQLHKLESLNWHCKGSFPRNLNYPSSLKKLTLESHSLHAEDLRTVGSLPRLEVLEMSWKFIYGNEWNPVEGEFLCLKSLGIQRCMGLINWNAESSHFPVLERLQLVSLHLLDEIPFAIGEIPTLEVIDVLNCSMSSTISAVEILEEQESFENDGLRVEVVLRDEDQEEKFRQKVEHFECFRSKNLKIGSIKRI